MVYGRNSVMEIIKSGKSIEALYTTEGKGRLHQQNSGLQDRRLVVKIVTGASWTR